MVVAIGHSLRKLHNKVETASLAFSYAGYIYSPLIRFEQLISQVTKQEKIGFFNPKRLSFFVFENFIQAQILSKIQNDFKLPLLVLITIPFENLINKPAKCSHILLDISLLACPLAAIAGSMYLANRIFQRTFVLLGKTPETSWSLKFKCAAFLVYSVYEFSLDYFSKNNYDPKFKSLVNLGDRLDQIFFTQNEIKLIPRLEKPNKTLMSLFSLITNCVLSIPRLKINTYNPFWVSGIQVVLLSVTSRLVDRCLLSSAQYDLKKSKQ